MPRTTTVTVRLNGALSDFVSANVGENGAYANVNEYIRGLPQCVRAGVSQSAQASSG